MADDNARAEIALTRESIARTPGWFAAVRASLVEIAELTGYTDDLAGLPGHVGALVEQRDQARAEVDEANERADKAEEEAVLRQATLSGLSVEEGAAVLKLGPPREVVVAWVDAARKMLGEAENYSETRIDFPRESFSMDVKAAGEFDHYVFTVQRAGKVTPHEARKRAEAESADLRARLARAEQERDEERAQRKHVEALTPVGVWQMQVDAERESRIRWAEEAGELEARLARAAAAVHVADAEDLTDRQRGYRACSERALAELRGVATQPAVPVSTGIDIPPGVDIGIDTGPAPAAQPEPPGEPRWKVGDPVEYRVHTDKWLVGVVTDAETGPFGRSMLVAFNGTGQIWQVPQKACRRVSDTKEDDR